MSGSECTRVQGDLFTVNPNSYDNVIVAFSGGKDSLACVLHILELGVPRERIELWHHDVDGRENSDLMDWPVTADYCRKVAQALGVPIYYSWKVGGFEGEMLRENARTAPTCIETPDGVKELSWKRGKRSTRRKFPQVSANLSVRWCSAYLKIDVCAKAVNHQERFLKKRVLIVTGERAEESTARANYAEVEAHRTNGAKRTVHQWRPVHAWPEARVWEIIARWRINPHPAYRLGWGRVSCMTCIFGSPNQWASVRQIAPDRFKRIREYEREFGCTIQRGKSVGEQADGGSPYAMHGADIKAALSPVFHEQVVLEEWELPSGAFGESCGPT